MVALPFRVTNPFRETKMAKGTKIASTTSGLSGQFTNANFSPIIFSKKAQVAFRKTSVVEDITNNDYFGEISNIGDSVRIIKEPDITVNAYTRGTDISQQALTDADFTMIIDMANYFSFKLDDLEDAITHVNFMELATDRAAYKIRDSYDTDVLQYLCGFDGSDGRSTTVRGTKADSNAGSDELLAANKLDITDFGGSDLGVASEVTSIPLTTGSGASGKTDPLELVNRMKRLLDSGNVPTDGRWLVVDPVFVEKLMNSGSKLINNDFAGAQDAGDMLRNGRMSGMLRGFRMYVSNNLPSVGTGPGTVSATGSETNFGVVVAGHDSAAATAQQINKTETYRDPDSFADIVRGLHMYGTKILRPEALVTANYNLGE